MSTSSRALELADKVAATGLAVTCDPRGYTPPCVLFAPPPLTFDLGCGASAQWGVWLLVPGPANLDAWQVLDDMLATVVGVLDVERADFMTYSPSPDAPPVPGYRVQFTEGVEI